MEANAGIGAGLVLGLVGGGLNAELVGGLDEDQAMIGDGLRVAAEHVGIDVERAGHLRSCGQ
jgi:hypothetical protein